MTKATGSKVLATAGRCNRAPIVQQKVVVEKAFSPLLLTFFSSAGACSPPLFCFCWFPGHEKRRGQMSLKSMLSETKSSLSFVS